MRSQILRSFGLNRLGGGGGGSAPNMLAPGTFTDGVEEFTNAGTALSLTNPNGVLRGTKTTTSSEAASKEITGLIVGAVYDLVYTIDTTNKGSAAARLRVESGSQLATGTGPVNIGYTLRQLYENETVEFEATHETMYFGVRFTGAYSGVWFDLDNISLRLQAETMYFAGGTEMFFLDETKMRFSES